MLKLGHSVCRCYAQVMQETFNIISLLDTAEYPIRKNLYN